MKWEGIVGNEVTQKINVCVGSWRFVDLKLLSGIANYWSFTVFFFKKAYRTRHTIREACVGPGVGRVSNSRVAENLPACFANTAAILWRMADIRCFTGAVVLLDSLFFRCRDDSQFTIIFYLFRGVAWCRLCHKEFDVQSKVSNK